jgi:hypothetical protein
MHRARINYRLQITTLANGDVPVDRVTLPIGRVRAMDVAMSIGRCLLCDQQPW